MTNISTLGQNIFVRSQILRLQQQMNVLQEQVASGKKSTVFSGINDGASLSLQLNNAKKATGQFVDNITGAKLRIQPMQAVLQRITDLANEVRNDALIASSDGLPTAKGNGALKALAQQRLREIQSLLNTRVGNEFLFGGRNTSLPPLPDFGNISDASSILGQVSNLNSTAPLGLNIASGDIRYDTIKSFLNNGITKVTPTGATAPSPYGYVGESGQPGGNAYKFTVSNTVLTTDPAVITVDQGFDLPAVGQYIEFGTIPPHNAAYEITAVNSTTREITFQRIPAGTITGLDFDVAAGTAVNVTTPAVVTTVEPPSAFNSIDTSPLIQAAAAAGSTTIDVDIADVGDYGVGDLIQFGNGVSGLTDPNTYRITGIAGSTLTIENTAIGGGGLVVPITGPNAVTPPGNEMIRKVPGGAFSGADVGATSLRVHNITAFEVGDRVSFTGVGGDYYDITAVDQTTNTISFVQTGVGSGGLLTAIEPTSGAPSFTTTILQGYPPGSTVIDVADNTGVTPGMAVKFSNSATIYSVVRVIGTTQVEISTESTSSGAGLEDPLFSHLGGPPLGPAGAPGVGVLAGSDITVSFGNRIDPLKARVDTGVDVEYGIRADNPAIRTVLNALFALATTDLNTTTEGGFRKVAIRAATDLARGSQLVTDLASELGVKENTLDATETRHKDFTVVLDTQLDRVENVDMAEAVSKLTQTQSSLEASYQLLASLRNLSLSNFL